MVRKVTAILLMALSVVGSLICAGALLGAWLVNEPTTNAAVGAFEAVDGYLGLAAQATTQVGAQLEDIQRSLADVGSLDPEQKAEVLATLAESAGPTVQRIDGTLTMLANGANALNQTLSQMDRLPGVTAPLLGDELQGVEQRIASMNSTFDELVQHASAADIDGEQLAVLVETISEELRAVEGILAVLAARLAVTRAATVSARDATPGIVDMTSFGVGTLFALLLAGQFSLFIHALNWFRRKPLSVPDPSAVDSM